MTGAKPSNYAKVQFACGNEVWLPPPTPALGDYLWCIRCQQYCEVGPGEALQGTVYYADYQWTSRKHPVRGWTGTCDVCSYQHRVTGTGKHGTKWYDLKAHMERHHLKEHTGSSLVSNIEIVPVPALPRNSPPPF